MALKQTKREQDLINILLQDSLNQRKQVLPCIIVETRAENISPLVFISTQDFIVGPSPSLLFFLTNSTKL